MHQECKNLGKLVRTVAIKHGCSKGEAKKIAADTAKQVERLMEPGQPQMKPRKVGR